MNMIQRLLRWCPGALGVILRQWYYPRILGSCGKKVIFGRFLTIPEPEKVSIADHVILSNFVSLCPSGDSTTSCRIVLEQHVFIGSFCRLEAENGGVIVVKEGANLGSSCELHSTSFLEIGANTLLAGYCHLGVPRQTQQGATPAQSRETKVGEACWLGVRVRQYCGTEIGKQSIVGAHAFVENDIPDYSIAVGRPAAVQRRRSENG